MLPEVQIEQISVFELDKRKQVKFIDLLLFCEWIDLQILTMFTSSHSRGAALCKSTRVQYEPIPKTAHFARLPT